MKEEFESFELIKLDKIAHEYTHKDKLKKESIFNSEFTEIEKLGIDKIEHHISVENNVRLLEIIEENENNEREFKALELTKLVPDKNLVFIGKENLKKRRNVLLSIVRSPYSIAAVLALILFARIFNLNSNHNQNSFKNNTQNNKDFVTFVPENLDKNTSNNAENLITTTKIAFDETITNNEAQIKNIKSDSNNNKSQFESSSIYEYSAQNVANIVPVKEQIPSYENVKLLEKSIGEVIHGSDNKILLPALANNYSKSSIREINAPAERTVLLTPKEFLIKQVKGNLNIDDKHYDRIDPVKTLIAVADKSKIVNVTYVNDQNDNQKEITFSIGGFEFQRKW